MNPDPDDAHRQADSGPGYDDEPAPADDDVWHEDPDAAPTAEGRVAQARAELKKLIVAALGATGMMGAVVVAVEIARGQGFNTTTGFLVGALLATVNLWLLAGGFFAAMRGSGMGGRGLLAFFASFIALILMSVWVVLAHRDWTLGFAIGLTTPALAGILYARTLPR